MYQDIRVEKRILATVFIVVGCALLLGCNDKKPKDATLTGAQLFCQNNPEHEECVE